MDWYLVIKTINGRPYRYRQKTWREGKRVRTRSEYLGPAGEDVARPRDLSGAVTLPLPFGVWDLADLKTLIDDLSSGQAVHTWQQPWVEGGEDTWNIVEPSEAIDQLVAALGPTFQSFSKGAYYNPVSDIVNVPKPSCFIDTAGERATEGYYITLLHELAHWTGAKSRLDRNIGHRTRIRYAREELVAEATAVYLMRHFRMAPGELRRQRKYFQSGQSGPRADRARVRFRGHANRIGGSGATDTAIARSCRAAVDHRQDEFDGGAT